MRRLVLPAALVTVVAFLLATNPVVADAARLVTGKGIKNGSVTGVDIKDRSLRRIDFARGQVPAGPRGAAGADGVVATAWTDYRYDRDSGYVPVSLPANGTDGDVVSLASGPGQRSGPIVVREASRLFITADAFLHNGDTTSRAILCSLELRPVGGAPVQISFGSYDSLAQYENKTWSQSTTEAVGPGTYDLALRCSTGLANGGGRVFHADLNVLAVRTT